MATTTISRTEYESRRLSVGSELYRLSALDILKARASPCRLGFIFLGDITKNSRRPFYDLVNHWVKIALNYNLYCTTFREKKKIPNTNAIITVVINRSDLPELMRIKFQQPMFYHFAVIVSSQDKSFDVCFPQLVKVTGVSLGPMRCISEINLIERNYASLVDKETSQWEEWCVPNFEKFEILLPAIQKNLVGPFIKQLALQIFSTANVSLAKYPRCLFRSSRHVQLKFNAEHPLKILTLQ